MSESEFTELKDFQDYIQTNIKKIASNLKLLYNLILLIFTSCKSRFRQINDLDIIKQLEQEIGKKLVQISFDQEISIFNKNGYILNENNKVVGINLDEDNLNVFPVSIIKLTDLCNLSIIENN